MERTDFELVEAFRAGDVAAADALMRRHLARVRNLVFQLVLDNTAADDLTQDVFVRAVRGLTTFRGQASVATWLHRIALNVTCRYLRQNDRRRTIDGVPETAATAAAPPVVRLIEQEGNDRIADSLARLSPSLRAAIVLTVMQGLTAAEAADIEECPVGTMYWRIHEARRQLREDLKGWIE